MTSNFWFDYLIGKAIHCLLDLIDFPAKNNMTNAMGVKAVSSAVYQSRELPRTTRTLEHLPSRNLDYDVFIAGSNTQGWKYELLTISL